MELSSPIVNCLKISSKRGYILIDPDASEDAKIIILSDGSDQNITQTDDNLVIFGPGDYEASGILIKGSRPENDTIYSIDTSEGRALIASSNSISKLTDEDEYDVVVVKAVTSVDEAALAALSSKLVVVYGSEDFIPETLKEKRVAKVNLKKREEIEGNVVYLEKK